MIHYHHCPECYDIHACEMDCTIEPDIADPDTYPGKEFGSHCMCNTCKHDALTPARGTRLYTKEWWDRYHGFIK